MRLGIVAPEFPPAIGGMEDHAAGLADALAADNDVTVFTKEEYAGVEYSGRYSVRPILNGRIILDSQKLTHERFDRWLTLNATYSYLSQYVGAPVFAYCHGNDFLKPWTDVLTRPERAFVDVLGGLPYCWRFKLPIERKLGRRKIASGLADSKVIFTNSAHTQKLLAATFPTVRTPIVVSWPGVAEHFFQAPNTAGVQRSGPLRLLTVARLCRTKNIGNVLRALAMVKDEVDFTYTVVGDGNLRQELESLAENLKISSRTQFLGSLASPNIVGVLDSSDLLLLPSLGESFGIAYAEAAARGVPSLASKTGGAMDAVMEGVNGIIVDGPEPSQIADGIRRFSQMRPGPDRDEIRRFAVQFRRLDMVARLRDTVLGPA